VKRQSLTATKKVTLFQEVTFSVVYRRGLNGLFDDPLGYIEDGFVFERNDATIRTRLNMLGYDLAVFIFFCPKIIADGLLFNVEFVSNALTLPVGKACLILLNSSKVMFILQHLD
jgi:hypothetical protein